MQNMVLIVDEADGAFSGLKQVSDERLAGVEGKAFSSAADEAGPVTSNDLSGLNISSTTSIGISTDIVGAGGQITANSDGTISIVVSVTVNHIVISQTYTVSANSDDALILKLIVAGHFGIFL
jgi:hypothetical protein